MKKIIFLMIFCTLGITNNSAAMFSRISSFANRLVNLWFYDLTDEHRLYSAIKTGNMSAVKELLSNKSKEVAELLPNFPQALCDIIGGYCSDIEAKPIINLTESTALHVAAIQGDRSMVKLLIDRGYDLECKDCMGDTPLHAAIVMGNDGAAEALIEAGAVVDVLNEQGFTPLASALVIGSRVGAAERNKFEYLVKEKGYDRSRIVPDHLRCVRLLLKAGANPNCVVLPGIPALHFAVAGGNADVVRLLLAFKADPMVQADDGGTAIDFAKTEEMRNLLRDGASGN
jgi:hypothetical protein